MYVYNYRLFDRYNRVVVSLAVLGDNRLGWRPNRYAFEMLGCGLQFRFPSVKLLDYAKRVAKLEKDRNPFAALVLAHLKTQETNGDPEARRSWKFRLIKGLLERGLSREEIGQLFRLIDWMMDLPEAHEKLFWEDYNKLKREKKMPFIDIAQRMGREEGRKKGIREGLKKGIEKGMEKGREKGREEGREEGLLEGIESVVEIKFGAKGLQFLPTIRQIGNPEKLREILRAIKSLNSLDELRHFVGQKTQES